MVGARIKKIREENKLTLEAFGNRISMTRSAIGLIEKGSRNATDRVISDICREFNVSESWLRNGEGEMFIETSRDEELARWAGRLLGGKSEEDEFIKKFVHTLSKLDSRDWDTLRKIATAMSEQNKNKQAKLDE